jgi:hypothetical protein
MENKIALPHLRVARASHPFALDDENAWDVLDAITPLYLADGSGPAIQQTRVRVCFDERALYVRFDCDDRDIWGTYTKRDEPIYDEEVVEVFVAAGEAAPIQYFEFQVSPNEVLFDATIYNPASTREHLKWDATWQCPGLRWMAQRDDAKNCWWGAFAIPWASITADGKIPSVCRANFYRIERPRDAETEYSCWSPTLTDPADFHKPARFGFLEFSV